MRRGAFDGLADVIGKRLGSNSIGFCSDIKSKKGKGTFHDVIPHDLIKYGLIPEACWTLDGLLLPLTILM